MSRHVRETLVTHAFQQNAERDESEIAVDHARAGLVLQIEIRNRARGPLGFIFREQIQRTPRGQT